MGSRMNCLEVLREKREEILALAAKHKASRVRLFGSVVRGEDTPESDVDFLVAFEPEASLLDRIRLINDLEDLLGRKVEVVREDTVHWFIRNRVLQEAQAL